MKRASEDLGSRSEKIVEQEDSANQSAVEKPQDRRNHLEK